jgi:hypothetical protein
MLSRIVRRVALGATVAATSMTGLTASAYPGGCVEIDDTTSRTAPTGEITVTQVCELVTVLRPPDPSQTNGRGYRLADGSTLWLSEADWWALMDQAAEDIEWREANRDLLVLVGILECRYVVIPVIKTIEMTERYRICEPTWDPRERLDWPVVQTRNHWFGDEDREPGAPTGHFELLGYPGHR